MDYSDYQTEKPGDNLLAQISETARLQLELEDDIARMEEALRVKKAEYAVISGSTLPELMDAADMAEFRLRDGRRVAIKTEVRANISKARATAACNWLRSNGFGALVKNVVMSEFGRGEDEKAHEAIEVLSKLNLGHVSQSETVNHQTLSAWVRRHLEENPNAVLPVDLLGITHQRIAKIE